MGIPRNLTRRSGGRCAAASSLLSRSPTAHLHLLGPNPGRSLLLLHLPLSVATLFVLRAVIHLSWVVIALHFFEYAGLVNYAFNLCDPVGGSFRSPQSEGKYAEFLERDSNSLVISFNVLGRLAHPGGPLTTNKAAALAKFLERKLQQPGGLDSIDPNVLELAVKNAKETVKASKFPWLPLIVLLRFKFSLFFHLVLLSLPYCKVCLPFGLVVANEKEIILPFFFFFPTLIVLFTHAGSMTKLVILSINNIAKSRKS